MLKKIALICCVFLIAGCNSTKLGGGIYLLEGDRAEDRIIVKCTGQNFNECITGDYLIPRSYNDHFDSNGHYVEYVEKVKSNRTYIIATSILVSSNEKRYWIIIKRGRPTIEVLGPLDYNSFNIELKKNNVRLNF